MLRADVRHNLALIGIAASYGSIGCEALIGANFDPRPLHVDASTPTESPFKVVQAPPEGETLTAIWGYDAQNIIAVGRNGVRYHYADGIWTRSQLGGGRDYYAIWGTSSTDVYAVGTTRGDARGFVVHFDGSAWVDEYIADEALYGVWGADNLVYAVGAQGMLYGKYVGTTDWAKRLSKGLPANPSVPASPDAPILWSIAGNNADNFAIAADADRIFHYVGKGDFVNLDPIVDRTIVFRTAWAAPGPSTNIFFGSNHLGISWLGETTSDPTDGSASTEEIVRLHEDKSLSGSENLFVRGIWGDPTFTVFVGDLGHIYSYGHVSNQTQPIVSPTTAALCGVWGSSPDDVWIVGQRELILHGRVR